MLLLVFLFLWRLLYRLGDDLERGFQTQAVEWAETRSMLVAVEDRPQAMNLVLVFHPESEESLDER